MPRIKLREMPEIDMTIQTGAREMRVPKGRNDWITVSDVEAVRCRKQPQLIVEDDEVAEVHEDKPRPRKAGRGD
jgi:hypothetical protein